MLRKCGLNLERNWRTHGSRAQNASREYFLGTLHSLLWQFFLLHKPCCSMKCVCVCVCVCVCTCVCIPQVQKTVCGYQYCQMTLRMNTVYINRNDAKLTGDFVGGGLLHEYVTSDQGCCWRWGWMEASGTAFPGGGVQDFAKWATKWISWMSKGYFLRAEFWNYWDKIQVKSTNNSDFCW